MAVITKEIEVGHVRKRICSRRWLCFILTVSSLFFFATSDTASAATTNQISQFGITWTFDGQYEYGQFVNGDYWVVGPVTIIDIDPLSTDTDGRVMNGSMIDPNGDNNHSGTSINTHGFDSRATGFVGSLNVARPGGANLSVSNPLVIQPDASLVSSKSFVDNTGLEPQLEDFAVLTILSEAPPANSFRPAFASTDKTIKYNLTDVNLDAFADLTPAGGHDPSFADVNEWFKYPGICIASVTRATEIAANRVSQHDNYTEAIGQSLLLLNCNYSDDQKRIPAIHILQHGIDRYGILTENAGGRKIWYGIGGFHMGVKLTMMAAAKVLGDDAMLADIGNKSGDYWENGTYGRQTWPDITVPDDYYWFAEDDNTFYLSSWDIGEAPFMLWSHGGGYQEADRYQTAGTVKVTNGSTTVVGVGTTWLTVDYKGDYSNPGVWFGVVNDDQANSRAGRVYDVDEIVSDTELRLASPYAGNTDQTGAAAYMLGICIRYGHGTNPTSWSNYRGTDINEPPPSYLGYPVWQDGYLTSGTAGLNAEVFNWGYRENCGRNFGSQALVALIMGLKSAWNNDAFFDYTDRYIPWARAEGEQDFQDLFAENMWDAYRTDYGTVWTADSNGSSNAAPVLSYIGAKSVDENTLLSFTISATDADGDSITLSASNLPTGASFSSPTFSWTPGYDQGGSYDVTFTASDGNDTDSEVVTITVGNINRAPVLASIGAKSTDENTLLNFTISATDADSDSITYSASN
ncbi:MAG: putative Ig domain-containing protein, partial [Planctomycetota bacterium]